MPGEGHGSKSLRITGKLAVSASSCGEHPWLGGAVFKALFPQETPFWSSQLLREALAAFSAKR